MIEHAREVVRATSLPVLVDMDDGYAMPLLPAIRFLNFLKPYQILRLFIIEDQRYPKRCGHIAGKDIVSLDEFMGKLEAVLDIRAKLGREKVVVVARTDALNAASGRKDARFGGDIKETVKRLCAFASLGVDVGWAETNSPNYFVALEIVKRVRDKFSNFPLAYNVSPSFSLKDWERWVDETSDERLNDLGYKLRFVTYYDLVVIVRAVEEAIRLFKVKALLGRSLRSRGKQGVVWQSIMKLVGVPEDLELERRFIPEAQKRQEQSEGFR